MNPEQWVVLTDKNEESVIETFDKEDLDVTPFK